MALTPLENFAIIIGVITGILGSITGIISLSWQIKNDRPKLKLERASFQSLSSILIENKKYKCVKVNLTLRNIGNRQTTIEEIYINIGSVIREPDFFEEINMPGPSSKPLEYILKYEESEFEWMFAENNAKFEILIIHTKGHIKKSALANLHTGNFNMI